MSCNYEPEAIREEGVSGVYPHARRLFFADVSVGLSGHTMQPLAANGVHVWSAMRDRLTTQSWKKPNVAPLGRYGAAALFTALAIYISIHAGAPQIYLLVSMAVVLRCLGPGPSILSAALSTLSIVLFRGASPSHTYMAEILTFLCGASILLFCFADRRRNSNAETGLKKDQERSKHEESLRLVVDTIPALVWCADPDGGPVFLNKRMAEFVGLSEQELIEGSARTGDRHHNAIVRWKQLFHPDDYEAARAVWTKAVTTGQPYFSVHRLRRADGQYRWCQSLGEPIRDESGVITRWYGINIDVDEARRNEERLSEAREKLSRTMRVAEIAELSASVAHEINQPLAAILANSQACQHWIVADPPDMKRLSLSVERIVRDCKATSDIISRVRALFKQAVPDKVSLDLNEVIQEVFRLVRDQARRKNIRIDASLCPNLPLVQADRVQVQQLLMNLVANAIDAMPADPDQPSKLAVSSRLRANMIEVNVRDSGSGLIDKDKIFEPFYTTKKHGMGMGLAICRTIAEMHGGSLYASANPDRGSTFTFTLPIGRELPASLSPRGSSFAVDRILPQSLVAVSMAGD